MSLNAGINATIALIEDRPEQFKEMLRYHTSDVKDLPAVRRRLYKALNFFSATKIRWALMQTLHLDMPVTLLPEDPMRDTFSSEELNAATREAFFSGVCAAEKVFESLVKELEEA